MCQQKLALNLFGGREGLHVNKGFVFCKNEVYMVVVFRIQVFWYMTLCHWGTASHCFN
jgi:hypothetical protein